MTFWDCVQIIKKLEIKEQSCRLLFLRLLLPGYYYANIFLRDFCAFWWVISRLNRVFGLIFRMKNVVFLTRMIHGGVNFSVRILRSTKVKRKKKTWTMKGTDCLRLVAFVGPARCECCLDKQVNTHISWSENSPLTSAPALTRSKRKLRHISQSVLSISACTPRPTEVTRRWSGSMCVERRSGCGVEG